LEVFVYIIVRPSLIPPLFKVMPGLLEELQNSYHRIASKLNKLQTQVTALGGGGGTVTSVFGRTGVVTATIGDYTFAKIGSTPVSLAGYGIADAYTKAQIDAGYASLTGSYSNPAWITALAWGKITGAPAFITGNQSISFTPGAGDVTGSASGATSLTPTLTIAANAVTFAKMQTIPTVTIIGNSTGGSAVPQSITLGASLAFSGTALQTVAMTGDVTSSANSFATTIAANAVTFAKMQTIPTVSLMGNSTGGSAVPQAITLGSGLSFSGTTLTATAGTGITRGNANAMRQNVPSGISYSF
jgi:hypothetical protein